MTKTTKIRVRGDTTRTEVLALVAHPMKGAGITNSQEPDQSRPDYIEYMWFSLNDITVAEVFLSPNIAANPLTAIALEETIPGDRVSVQWSDSRGDKGGAVTAIK